MNKVTPVTAILLLLLAVANPAAPGELYKWVDEQGKVHYGDNPPKNVQLKKVTGNVSSYSSVSVEPLLTETTPGDQSGEAKSVVMYATSWCGYCRKARKHFRANGIAFKEYDIEKSKSAAAAFKKLNGRGVPVILIGGQRMNGFSAETFDRIYEGNP